MARQAKIKAELITSLPSDPALRKHLQDLVNEGVQEIKDTKLHQENLRTILSVAKDTRDICPKFLKTLIKFEYDKQNAAEKARAALDEQVEQIAELDILMGRSKPPVEQDEQDDGQEDGDDDSEMNLGA